MAERKLTTDITFKGEAKAFTTFILEPLECSGNQTMRFILDDSDYEGECQEAECTLSLDELEYLIQAPKNDKSMIIRIAREKLGLVLPEEIIYYSDPEK